MANLTPDQIKKLIAQKLETDSRWKIYFDQSWVCPYCVDIAVGDLSRYPDPVPRVYRHLIKDCSDFAEKTVDGEASLQELKSKIFYFRNEAIIKKNLVLPLWKYFDLKDFWICPYCAQATRIPKTPLEVMAPLVLEHLKTCFAYEKGKGRPKNEAYLKKLTEHAYKTIRLKDILKDKLQADGSWKMTSKMGYWICPICAVEQAHVDVSNPLSLTLNAPSQIAKHLLSSCTKFTMDKLVTPAKPKSKTRTIAIPLDGKARLKLQPQPAKPVSIREDPAEPTDHIPLFTKQEAIKEISSRKRKTPTRIRKIPTPSPFLKAALAPIDPLSGGEKFSSTQQIQISSRSLDMLPLLPHVPEVEFQYVFEVNTSSQMDLLDFVNVTESEVGIILVNVEKNLPMPLVMELKEFIQTVASATNSPKEFLLQIKDTFVETLAVPISLKVSYFIIDVEKNILRLSRAGHTPLVLFNMSRNRNFHVLKPKGSPLIKGDSLFQEEGGELRVKLQEGDLLVAYNSGFVNWTNGRGDQLGEEGFYKMVFQYGRHEAEYFRHKFLEKFDEFKGADEVKQNMVILAMKYKGKEE